MTIQALKDAAELSEAEDADPNTKVYDNFRYLANPSAILSLIASHQALEESLCELVGILEIASVMPEAIQKVYVPRMDAPELDRARTALSTLTKE